MRKFAAICNAQFAKWAEVIKHQGIVGNNKQFSYKGENCPKNVCVRACSVKKEHRASVHEPKRKKKKIIDVATGLCSAGHRNRFGELSRWE